MAKHWSENDFLMAIYGVGPEDGHLDTCTECRNELQRRQQARRELATNSDVPADFLVEQRRRIDERIELPRRGWMLRWVPALGAITMALVLLIWHGQTGSNEPASRRVAQTAASPSDAQVFAEIYQTAYDLEPGAVTPVKALFEAR